MHNIPDIWRQTKGRLKPSLTIEGDKITFGHDRRIDLSELSQETQIRIGLIIPVELKVRQTQKNEIEQGD